jgi:hypothetical protein
VVREFHSDSPQKRYIHRITLFIHILSLTKRQFVVNHRYLVLQETEKLDRSLIDHHLGLLCFYENTKRGNFLWAQHFDRRCVLTHLSSNVGISV